MSEQENSQRYVSPEQIKVARDAAERQIHAALEQFAQHIPNGEQYIGQARMLISSGLDLLEQHASGQLNTAGQKVMDKFGDMLGGFLGKKE
jgi:hypothetical protein